ncbi:MAG: RNA polymerase sigma factor, partial [Myxococcota bacterium]|nr:RNA polymerase sigma factor [Myxococcota bacterium]
VQDVFIRAMRERRFFDPEFRMKAWLFRVTSNLCFNRVRDKKRRGQLLEQQKRSEGVLAKQVDSVFAGQRTERMNVALEQLTEAHREILILRYYDDLSYAEIAETLNIALGTVMSRLSRARCRLLEAVGQQKAELDP